MVVDGAPGVTVDDAKPVMSAIIYTSHQPRTYLWRLSPTLISPLYLSVLEDFFPRLERWLAVVRWIGAVPVPGEEVHVDLLRYKLEVHPAHEEVLAWCMEEEEEEAN